MVITRPVALKLSESGFRPGVSAATFAAGGGDLRLAATPARFDEAGKGMRERL